VSVLRGPRRRPRRRPAELGPHSVLLVGVSASALAACAKIGEDVFDHETDPFDRPIRRWVLAHQTPAATRAFLLVTRVGAPAVVVPGAALVSAWFWRRRGLPIAAAVVLSPAVATALFLVTKRLYARQRPVGRTRPRLRTYAFPSGHATASAAVFGTLAYVFRREDMLSARQAAALAVSAPLAIGASRVYLDAHWSTDVLGGWSLGGLVAALSAAVYERVRRETRERGEPTTTSSRSAPGIAGRAGGHVSARSSRRPRPASATAGRG